MLVIKSTTDYDFVIPAPFSHRQILNSFSTLEKIFVYDPIHMIKRIQLTDPFIMAELYMRGFFIAKNEKIPHYSRWEYIYFDKNLEDTNFSKDLVKFFYTQHPLYAFFYEQTNAFFQYVPLLFLERLIRHSKRKELRECILKYGLLIKQSQLPNQSLLTNDLLKEDYFGLRLAPETLDFLFQHGIFYYEDFIQLDITFLQLLPKIGPVKLKLFLQQYDLLFQQRFAIKNHLHWR